MPSEFLKAKIDEEEDDLESVTQNQPKQATMKISKTAKTINRTATVGHFSRVYFAGNDEVIINKTADPKMSPRFGSYHSFKKIADNVTFERLEDPEKSEGDEIDK